MIRDNDDPKELRKRIVILEKQHAAVWRVFKRFALFDDRLAAALQAFKEEMAKP